MAKYRSKKDRARAHQRRLSKLTTTSPAVHEEKETSKIIIKKVDHAENIFTHDPKLIMKDLRKTFAVVLFILLILLVIALIYT